MFKVDLKSFCDALQSAMEIDTAQERMRKQTVLASRQALGNLTNLLAQPLFPQPSRLASNTSSCWTSCTS
jgi:hypothetical protein